MPKALQVDLRERVVAAVSAGASYRAAAVRCGVSASSAIRWCGVARQSGSLAPGPLGGDRRSARVEVHAALILGLVEQKLQITLTEIQAELHSTGVPAGIGSILRLFDRHQITRKKKTGHAAEQDRLDVLSQRRDWFDAQHDLNPERLVFINGASPKMARTRGRPPRGKRLRSPIPHGHWKTTTFVAALRTGGKVAPMVLDGPINGIAVQSYVDQFPDP
jgi:transposase